MVLLSVQSVTVCRVHQSPGLDRFKLVLRVAYYVALSGTHGLDEVWNSTSTTDGLDVAGVIAVNTDAHTF